MYTYHPESWSKQARKLSNRALVNVNCGYWCIEQAQRFFVLSYRHRMIRERAAKRFGWALRHGRVHEIPSSVTKWKKYKEEHSLVALENMAKKYLEY